MCDNLFSKSKIAYVEWTQKRKAHFISLYFILTDSTGYQDFYAYIILKLSEIVTRERKHTFPVGSDEPPAFKCIQTYYWSGS